MLGRQSMGTAQSDVLRSCIRAPVAAAYDRHGQSIILVEETHATLTALNLLQVASG